MNKQPEQVLEEQLVEQLQTLNYCHGLVKNGLRLLIISKANILLIHKVVTVFKKQFAGRYMTNVMNLAFLLSIFVPTVSVLFAIRFTCGSLFSKVPELTVIYLPCLSLMHTWGVFSFIYVAYE